MLRRLEFDCRRYSRNAWLALVETGNCGDFRSRRWIDGQEEQHRYMVYITDPGLTNWTRHCLQRADEILSLAPPRAVESLGQWKSRRSTKAPPGTPQSERRLCYSIPLIRTVPGAQRNGSNIARSADTSICAAAIGTIWTGWGATCPSRKWALS